MSNPCGILEIILLPKKDRKKKYKGNFTTETISGFYQDVLGLDLVNKLVTLAHNDIPAVIEANRKTSTFQKGLKISQIQKQRHKEGAYAHRKRLARSASAAT